MNEENGTTDVVVVSRLQDEIQQLKNELDGTLKLPEYERALQRSPTKKGKKLFEVILKKKRALWEKVLELAWILEEKRMRECVTEAEEQGIIVEPKPFECPICLEDILKEEFPKGKTETFNCCGKITCHGCEAIINERTLEAKRRGDEAEVQQLLTCPSVAHHFLRPTNKPRNSS